MSHQSRLLTWYAWMPRTIDADDDFSYEFDPAVWWTATPNVVGPDCGLSQYSPAEAPHCARVMIDGCGVKDGAASTVSVAPRSIVSTLTPFGVTPVLERTRT